MDSASIQPWVAGGTGPNPTDRHNLGSKQHLITDAQGIPLAAILKEANRYDVAQLLRLVEATSLGTGHIITAHIAGRCGPWGSCQCWPNGSPPWEQVGSLSLGA